MTRDEAVAAVAPATFRALATALGHESFTMVLLVSDAGGGAVAGNASAEDLQDLLVRAGTTSPKGMVSLKDPTVM